MKRRATLFAAAALAWSAVLAAVQKPAASRVSYEDVRPIFEANCLECHSQDKRKGGLSLAAYGDILDGGKDGPIVRPGRSRDSMIIERLTGVGGGQMPKDAAPLADGEVAMIRRWIDEGARLTPSSPPAPPPWEAPLALTAPTLPAVVWPQWSAPADRIVAAYLREHSVREPVLVSDALFARRAYLDLWGLLPTPEEWQSFVADRAPDKRRLLVERLLADSEKYADHWISFWNDLLRNDDGVTYYSEEGARRSITPWLLEALRSNMPYDRFVTKLLNPTEPTDPEGFLIGVNWRGETSAAVTPWMQASQNTAQIFLGVNLKCNSCHDSFVSRWKLKDAYALAAFFAPQGRLQLFRCEVPQADYAEPAFLYPELNRTPPSASLADRRATAAAIFTDPRNGRLPRTIVNRLWTRLVGAGMVRNLDEMDGRPWSPPLLDWFASDFVGHRYDLKYVISQIVLSRAYQMPAVQRSSETSARDDVFAGPELRRLTSEQFADAVGSVTGEWGVSRLNIGRAAGAGAAPAGAGARGAGTPVTTPSDPLVAGQFVREWRMPSTNLSRALGRPIRDQVTSIRPVQATTPQALELVNGEILARQLLFGARRMLGQARPEPPSLYNKAVAGRQARQATFDVDITTVRSLWLLVQDLGSNDPDRVLPVWTSGEFVGADGSVTPLGRLAPVDPAGLRPGTGAIADGSTRADVVRVRNPSALRYDIAGRGYVRFRGVMWLENSIADIGATLDPQLRFYIFGDEPNVDRLVPANPGAPLPAQPVTPTSAQAVDRVFRHLLGRAPTAEERRIAERALLDPARPNQPSAEGLADLLWSVLMKPSFQFIR